MSIRILLVDDHRMVLEGLQTMLEQEADLEVVGLAEDGRSAVAMVEELAPEVVVLDVSMPELNGVDAARQILRVRDQTKIIGLSTYTSRRHVLNMLEAGAYGYVLKEAAADELIEAIRSVCRGRKYLSAGVTAEVVDSYVKRDFSQQVATETLGNREREVLQLIAEGLTSGEVAAKLHLSTHTVETHRRNIMKKLDLHSVAELTKYAVREGLTSIEE